MTLTRSYVYDIQSVKYERQQGLPYLSATIPGDQLDGNGAAAALMTAYGIISICRPVMKYLWHGHTYHILWLPVPW